MLELRKAALNGAFGVAGKSGKVVVPVYEKDPLKVFPAGNSFNWPDLAIVMDSSLMILRVRLKEAYTLLPFKRLDYEEIQMLGLIYFKDLLNNAKVTFVMSSDITYKEIATLASKYNLSGYLHRQFLQKLTLK